MSGRLHWRRLDFWLMALCLALVAAACGSADVAEPDAESEPVTASSTQRACEQLGYPCDWRDADPDVLSRSLSLLDETADRLDSGTPEEVAAHLDTVEGVVATNWAPEGVVFRLDGGLPVTALTEQASPIWVESAAKSDETRGARASATRLETPRPTTAQLATMIASLQADRATSFEPTREPDLRPRSVMVLSPTRSADRAAAIDAAIASGAPAQADAPTATRDAFIGSDHFEVLDLPDGMATPQRWASMASYDVVVVETHGAFYAPDGSDDVWGLFLAGPLADPYLLDLGLTAEEAKYKDFGGWTVAKLSIDREYHISFHDDFFDALPGSGVGNTIVMLNACRMGEDDVSTTALASTVAGERGGVFYWDGATPRNASDATTALLADRLIDGADARSAMDDLSRNRLHTAEYRSIVATLDLYQESAGLRARDAVTTFVDGSVAEPGVTVAASGTPGDGAADHIEGVEVRIDAVVPGTGGSTKVMVTVDGRPLTVLQDGAEVTEMTLSDATIDAARTETSKGAWEHHRIDLDGARLPFDLTREDLTQARGHVWEVTVMGEAGGPTKHRVDPMIFRLGSIRVLNPVNSLPLAPGDEVQLEGRAADSLADDYPLLVRVEHLDESIDPIDYAVAVTINDTELIVGLNEFDSLGDGAFRLQRFVSIGSIDELRTQATVTAVLTRDDESGPAVVDEFVAQGIILILERGTGCDYLTGREMSDLMGRAFDNAEELSIFGAGDLCRWSSEWTLVEIGLSGREQVAQLRAAAAAGDPAAVAGFEDAAIYDLVSGNALEPSGIRTDGGAIQYTNFVNLSVVLDDSTAALIRVQGNVVVDEGPLSGLLDRLIELAKALREKL